MPGPDDLLIVDPHTGGYTTGAVNTQPTFQTDQSFNRPSNEDSAFSSSNTYFDRPDQIRNLLGSSEGESVQLNDLRSIEDNLSKSMGWGSAVVTGTLGIVPSVVGKIIGGAGALGGFLVDRAVDLGNNLSGGEGFTTNYGADNPIANFGKYIDEDFSPFGIKLNVPKSEEYEQKDLWGKMGSKEFWTQDFLDGAEYALANYVTGRGAISLATKLAGATAAVEGATAALSAAQASGVAADIEAATAALNTATQAAKAANTSKAIWMNTVYSAASESAVEAADSWHSIYNDLNDKINPETGQKYTERERQRIAGKGSANVFYANVPLLVASNYFENKLFFGDTVGKARGLARAAVQSGQEGAAEIYVAGLRRNALKEIGGGILREGLIEENVQAGIQSVEGRRAQGQLGDLGYTGPLYGLYDYAGQSIRNLGAFGKALAGQTLNQEDRQTTTAMMIGSIIGMGMGGYQGHSEVKTGRTEINAYKDEYKVWKEKNLIADNVLPDNINSVLRTFRVKEKDADGNEVERETYINPETQNIEVDAEKAAALSYQGLTHIENAQNVLSAIVENNRETHVLNSHEALAHSLWTRLSAVGNPNGHTENEDVALAQFLEQGKAYQANDPNYATDMDLQNRYKEIENFAKDYIEQYKKNKNEIYSSKYLQNSSLASVFQKKMLKSLFLNATRAFSAKQLLAELNPNDANYEQKKAGLEAILNDANAYEQKSIKNVGKYFEEFKQDYYNPLYSPEYSQLQELKKKKTQEGITPEESRDIDAKIKDLEYKLDKRNFINGQESRESVGTYEQRIKSKFSIGEKGRVITQAVLAGKSQSELMEEMNSLTDEINTADTASTEDVNKVLPKIQEFLLKVITKIDQFTPLALQNFMDKIEAPLKKLIDKHRKAVFTQEQALKDAKANLSKMLESAEVFFNNNPDAFNALNELLEEDSLDTYDSPADVKDLDRVEDLIDYIDDLKGLDNAVFSSLELVYEQVEKLEKSLSEAKEQFKPFQELADRLRKALSTAKNKSSDLKNLEDALARPDLFPFMFSARYNEALVNAVEAKMISARSVENSNELSDSWTGDISQLDMLQARLESALNVEYYQSVSGEEMDMTKVALFQMYSKVTRDDIIDAIENLKKLKQLAIDNKDKKSALQQEFFEHNGRSLAMSLGIDLQNVNGTSQLVITDNDLYNAVEEALIKDGSNVLGMSLLEAMNLAHTKGTLAYMEGIISDGIKKAGNKDTKAFTESIKSLSTIMKGLGITDYAMGFYLRNPMLYFRNYIYNELISNYSSEGLGDNIYDLFKVQGEQFNQSFKFENSLDLVQFEKDMNKIRSTIKIENGEAAVDSIIKAINLHRRVLALTALQNQLESDINNANINEAENEYYDEKVQSGQIVIVPTTQQKVAIKELVTFLFQKGLKGTTGQTIAYLRGFAGTGKTSVVVRWAFKLANITPSSVYAFSHKRETSEQIAVALGKSANEAGSLDDFLKTKTVAELAGYENIVFDEIGFLSGVELKAMITRINEINAFREGLGKGVVKTLFLGDPSQISKDRMSAIKAKTEDLSDLGLSNINVITPLTVPYRSDVSSIVQVQDLFRSNKANVQGIETVVSHGTGTINVNGKDQFRKGVQVAVLGRSQFFQAIKDKLIESAANGRSKIVILNTEDDVNAFRAFMSDVLAGTPSLASLDIMSYDNAQGLTRQEVYVAISENGNAVNGKSFKDPSNRNDIVGSLVFNTAMYTALSRASDYIFMVTDEAGNWSQATDSPSLLTETDAAKADLEVQRGLYEGKLDGETALYNELLGVPVVVRTRDRGVTTTITPIDPDVEDLVDVTEPDVEEENEEAVYDEEEVEDDQEEIDSQEPVSVGEAITLPDGVILHSTQDEIIHNLQEAETGAALDMVNNNNEIIQKSGLDRGNPVVYVLQYINGEYVIGIFAQRKGTDGKFLSNKWAKIGQLNNKEMVALGLGNDPKVNAVASKHGVSANQFYGYTNTGELLPGGTNRNGSEALQFDAEGKFVGAENVSNGLFKVGKLNFLQAMKYKYGFSRAGGSFTVAGVVSKVVNALMKGAGSQKTYYVRIFSNKDLQKSGQFAHLSGKVQVGIPYLIIQGLKKDGAKAGLKDQIIRLSPRALNKAKDFSDPEGSFHNIYRFTAAVENYELSINKLLSELKDMELQDLGLNYGDLLLNKLIQEFKDNFKVTVVGETPTVVAGDRTFILGEGKVDEVGTFMADLRSIEKDSHVFKRLKDYLFNSDNELIEQNFSNFAKAFSLVEKFANDAIPMYYGADKVRKTMTQEEFETLRAQNNAYENYSWEGITQDNYQVDEKALEQLGKDSPELSPEELEKLYIKEYAKDKKGYVVLIDTQMKTGKNNTSKKLYYTDYALRAGLGSAQQELNRIARANKHLQSGFAIRVEIMARVKGKKRSYSKAKSLLASKESAASIREMLNTTYRLLVSNISNFTPIVLEDESGSVTLSKSLIERFSKLSKNKQLAIVQSAFNSLEKKLVDNFAELQVTPVKTGEDFIDNLMPKPSESRTEFEARIRKALDENIETTLGLMKELENRDNLTLNELKELTDNDKYDDNGNYKDQQDENGKPVDGLRLPLDRGDNARTKKLGVNSLGRSSLLNNQNRTALEESMVEELNEMLSTKLESVVGTSGQVSFPNTKVEEKPKEKNKGNSTISERISDLFTTFPALSAIGTKEDYYNYIKSVFPQSKVQTILYNGSKSGAPRFSEFEGFSKGEVAFFSDNKDHASVFGEVRAYLLNITNPFSKTFTDRKGNIQYNLFNDSYQQFGAEMTDQDGIVSKDIPDAGFNIDEYIIFNPNQFHVLGSQKDLDQFKIWVESKEEKVEATQEEKDEITKRYLEDLANEAPNNQKEGVFFGPQEIGGLKYQGNFRNGKYYLEVDFGTMEVDQEFNTMNEFMDYVNTMIKEDSINTIIDSKSYTELAPSTSNIYKAKSKMDNGCK